MISRTTHRHCTTASLRASTRALIAVVNPAFEYYAYVNIEFALPCHPRMRNTVTWFSPYPGWNGLIRGRCNTGGTSVIAPRVFATSPSSAKEHGGDRVVNHSNGASREFTKFPR